MLYMLIHNHFRIMGDGAVKWGPKVVILILLVANWRLVVELEFSYFTYRISLSLLDKSLTNQIAVSQVTDWSTHGLVNLLKHLI